MFCSGFIIFINPLDILTLLMYDNFPIQKMNKLRTSQPHENLISVWKYLPVKTCIIQIAINLQFKSVDTLLYDTRLY